MTEPLRHLAKPRKTRYLVAEHVVERGVEFAVRHPVLFWLGLTWFVLSIWAQITGWPQEDPPEPGRIVYYQSCRVVPETCSTSTTYSF
jgi:hypothetical protein